MTILEMLKDNEILNIRVSYKCRWLIYDPGVGFTVYEHKYRQKGYKVIIETFDEETAVEKLKASGTYF